MRSWVALSSVNDSIAYGYYDLSNSSGRLVGVVAPGAHQKLEETVRRA